MAERLYGKGHVILFGSTATTDWTNLPIHPDFVPLMQRLTGYLAGNDGGEDALRVLPGSVFQTTVKSDLAGRELSGDPSRRSRGAWHGAGKVAPSGPEASGHPLPGYRTAGRLIASRPPVRTSPWLPSRCRWTGARVRPRRCCPPTSWRLLTRSGKSGVAAAAAAARVSRRLTKAGGGTRRELWMPLLVGAAVVALIEMVLAQRFSIIR